MEWQTVNRKGGGKGWNHGVQDQLMQSMTAMQNSISQLAQSICTRPPPGSKGQGKGKPSKGQGKGAKASPGERKNPNLKPEEERAEPTTEQVKCPKCPNTYNWTRVVCRSCGCKLPQGNVAKAPPPQKSAGPANAVGVDHLLVLPREAPMLQLSKEKPARPRLPKKKRALSRRKQNQSKNGWQPWTKDDPLREHLESQRQCRRARGEKSPAETGLDSRDIWDRPGRRARVARALGTLPGRASW